MTDQLKDAPRQAAYEAFAVKFHRKHVGKIYMPPFAIEAVDAAVLAYLERLREVDGPTAQIIANLGAVERDFAAKQMDVSALCVTAAIQRLAELERRLANASATLASAVAEDK